MSIDKETLKSVYGIDADIHNMDVDTLSSIISKVATAFYSELGQQVDELYVNDAGKIFIRYEEALKTSTGKVFRFDRNLFELNNLDDVTKLSIAIGMFNGYISIEFSAEEPDYKGFVMHLDHWNNMGVPYSISELTMLAKIYNTPIPKNEYE